MKVGPIAVSEHRKLLESDNYSWRNMDLKISTKSHFGQEFHDFDLKIDHFSMFGRLRAFYGPGITSGCFLSNYLS